MGLKDREKKRASVEAVNTNTAGSIMEIKSQKEAPVITAKEKEEPRSAIINCRIQPSLLKKVKAKCKEEKLSVNECVHQFFEQWAK